LFDFSVLKLKGSYLETVDQRTRLLSKEIIERPMGEVIRSIREDLSKGSRLAQDFKKAIFDCYYKQMRASVSNEFLSAGQHFAKSLSSNALQIPYTKAELEKAVYAIELSIAAEGLMRKLDEDAVGTIAELTTSCGINISFELIHELLESLNPFSKLKLGCLGFVSPTSTSREGVLMHARNLDANLVSTWNREPVLFLVEEPGFLKYAAVASAGVIYPGGISGMNEAGISVSLHEFSATPYRTYFSGRKAELAPFLQQRILREARTLDEAIAIAKRTKIFGAWTILVSDAKSQEVASIEISGDRIQVARKRANQPMGQSNHFLGSQMQNQYYPYSFGKLFESRSRLHVVENEMRDSSGEIDLDWMMDHLAGHTDELEGFRAFKRTAVKAYNVLSTIAIPQWHQIWMSVGDRFPAAHSYFAGFEIDFDRMEFLTIDHRRTKAYEAIPNWEDSLQSYVDSRLTYESVNLRESYRLSLETLEKAHRDDIEESTYRYILGRLALEMNKPHLALFHFERQMASRQVLAPYKQALVHLYSAAAIQNMSDSDRSLRRGQLKHALQSAETLLSVLDRMYDHFDLSAKRKLLVRIKNAQAFKLPPVDFVTVE